MPQSISPTASSRRRLQGARQNRSLRSRSIRNSPKSRSPRMSRLTFAEAGNRRGVRSVSTSFKGDLGTGERWDNRAAIEELDGELAMNKRCGPMVQADQVSSVSLGAVTIFWTSVSAVHQSSSADRSANADKNKGCTSSEMNDQELSQRCFQTSENRQQLTAPRTRLRLLEI